jgi:hypothetical protein
VIFQSPGCNVDYVAIDWLHCVDLGVAQTVVGNCLWECLDFLPGGNISSRVRELWERLKTFYQRANTSYRFQKLTEPMIRQPGKGPKLRGKAGETRHIVPFAMEMAKEFSGRSRHAALVHEVLEHLGNLYMYLDMLPFPAEAAADQCQLMCTKMVALSLEAQAKDRPKHWKIKPKMHKLQELLEYDCVRTGQSPRLFWTYLDESWGGIVAAMAMRRGGPKSAESIGTTLLDRYRAFVNEV